MAQKAPYNSTLTADGNTAWVDVDGPTWVSIGTGPSNSFGGGTAKIQRQEGSETWDIAGTSKTAAADIYLDFPEGVYATIRVNLASSTSPDLDVSFKSHPAV